MGVPARSFPEDEHLAVNFMKLTDLCVSETFRRDTIDLLNRDGPVAQCEARCGLGTRFERHGALSQS